MGAEVIKVESARQWDMLRSLHFLGGQTERWWDKAAYFNHNNRNKYGCTIDLQTPRGRELALRLAAISDIVVENYRADVLARLGLDYEDLRAVKPDIILVSMPSHGKSGPESNHVAYGTNVEQLAGLASLTGYPGMGPHKSAIAYGDPNAGAIAAAAALAALHHRRRTGEGQHIEVAQWEALTGNVGEFIIEYQMSGEIPEPIGNRHVSRVQGVYPCLPLDLPEGSPAGADQWVAISIGSDAEFAQLCRVIGKPALAGDPRFADVVSRRHNHDEFDRIVSAWTSTRTQREAASALQSAGVSAAPVLRIQELMVDENLRARGFWEMTTHADAGTWDMEGPTWRMSRTPAHVRIPAPSFGEHNGYVFGSLLGLTEDEIAELARIGVIATTPELSLHA
jgi:crotonobetainyl-CoA:carnitine CoA-transferase CaiB-like acyl-CoA transferase